MPARPVSTSRLSLTKPRSRRIVPWRKPDPMLPAAARRARRTPRRAEDPHKLTVRLGLPLPAPLSVCQATYLSPYLC